MKIALACSAGGHLTEIRQLEPLYRKRRHFFVTFRRDDSKELGEKAYFLDDPKRSPARALRNVLQSIRVFLRERPDMVITTGAGVAVPFSIISKLFRKRVVYIESYCRIRQPSLTGRLLYPFADLFLVQWEELLQEYGPKARCWGRLL